jgi:hypothetical protein
VFNGRSWLSSAAISRVNKSALDFIRPSIACCAVDDSKKSKIASMDHSACEDAIS